MSTKLNISCLMSVATLNQGSSRPRSFGGGCLLPGVISCLMSATAVFLGLLLLRMNNTSQRTFQAAVYEHPVILPPIKETPVSRGVALTDMMKNLEIYRIQAEKAGKMGVDILVFPENGIYGYVFTRETLEPYLEFIPDPKIHHWCPCRDPARFPNTEVQQFLSCLAKNNSLYLVANFGDMQPCNKTTHPGCPSDGHYQFNTNIVYDKTGLLVARYHKKLLYNEPQFDKPPDTEHIYFDTPFGRFGVITCFDILFDEPTVSLITKYNVSNVVFPAAWIDALPFLTAIQFHSAFAVGIRVNLLAANRHVPSFRVQGSGIYTPNGALAYYFNNQMADGKLLTSEIEVLLPGSIITQNKGHSEFKQSTTTDNTNSFLSGIFNWSIRHDIYTFQSLLGKKGNLTVCQKSLCCRLKYRGKIRSERFAFGVLDGLHSSRGDRNYYLQICALLKCESSAPETCEPSTKNSSTTFSHITITGNFSTKFVFPEMLSADNGALALSKIGDWKFRRNSFTITSVKRSLLSASLLGRIYEKDTDNYIK